MPQDPFDDIVRGYDQQFAPPKVKPVKPAKPPSFDDLIKDVDGQAGSVPTTRREQLRRSVTGLQNELTAATPQLKPGNTLNVATGRQYPTPPPPPFQSPIDMRLNAPNEAQKAFDRAAAATQPAPQPKPRNAFQAPRPKPILERVMAQQAIERQQPQTVETDPQRLEQMGQATGRQMTEQRDVRNRMARSAYGELSPVARMGARALAKIGGATDADMAAAMPTSRLESIPGQVTQGAITTAARIPEGLEQLGEAIPNPFTAITGQRGRMLREKAAARARGENTGLLTSGITKAGDALADVVAPVDKTDQSFLTAKLPRGLGSSVPFIASSALGGGMPAAAALGAAINAQQTGEDLDKLGVQDEATRRKATAVAGLIGSLEAFGIEGKLGKVFGGRGGLTKRLLGAGGEGLQEWTTEELNDINAKLIAAYDPNRSINPLQRKQLETAALGALTGGLFEAGGKVAEMQRDAQAVNQTRAERPVAPTDIRPTTMGPTQITPLSQAPAVPAPTVAPATSQSLPAATAPTTPLPQAQPQGFPRLPEPQGVNVRRAKLLGMPTPAEVNINEQVQAAAQLLDSTNEGDQRQGRRMLNKALTDLRKAEGYLAEAALPPDAPRPFTAVRDAIEAKLAGKQKSQIQQNEMPNPLSPAIPADAAGKQNSASNALRAEADAAKIKAAEFEQVGDFTQAAATYQAAHQNLKRLRRSMGMPKTPEAVAQINQIDREISIADANRRKANQAARTAQRQANAPTAGLSTKKSQSSPDAFLDATRPATFSRPESAQVQAQQQDARNISSDISAPQPFDQIVADVDAEPTNRLRDAEYEGGELQRYSKPLEGQAVEREAFQPDTADLREVREFAKREPRTEQFTEEPPTAPLARRRAEQSTGQSASNYPPLRRRDYSQAKNQAYAEKLKAYDDQIERIRQQAAEPSRWNTEEEAQITQLVEALRSKKVSEESLLKNLEEAERDIAAIGENPQEGWPKETRERLFRSNQARLEAWRRIQQDPQPRRRQPIRPPAPTSPRQVGNRPLSVDVAGTRTPTAMSPDFPRARREIVKQGREVEARLTEGQEKGEFGNVAEAMFKSNTPDVLHGQDSFFHDPDLKGKLGLTREAEMADVRRELKTQLARSLGLSADEVSLSHIKPEVWRAWAKQKGLGREAVRKLEAGIARAERKDNAIKTNAAITAEESQRAKEKLRQPETDSPNRKEVNPNIPPLEHYEGSYIVVRKADNQSILEMFKDDPRLEKINFEKYKLVPAGKYLEGSNRKLRETPNVETARQEQALEKPSKESQRAQSEVREPAAEAEKPVKKPRQSKAESLRERAYQEKAAQLKSEAGNSRYISPQVRVEIDGKSVLLDGAEVARRAGYEPVKGKLNQYQRQQSAPPAKSIEAQIKDIRDLQKFDLIDDKEAKRKIAALEAQRPKIAERREAQPKTREDVENSPEFKRWFGDSVVTENGKPGSKPLVVYHGTGQDFSEFDKSTFNKNESSGDFVGQGFFFTRIAERAAKYAEGYGRKSGNPQLMPVYLRIKNPLVINNNEDSRKLWESFGGEESYFDLVLDAPNRIREELQRRGYDGLIDNNYQQYAVFEPSQIKSAIGNRGTFDPNSAKITERRSEAMPERYTGRQLFENAQLVFRPARNRPATLVANDWGGAMLNRLLSEKFDVTTTDANFTIGAKDAKDLRDYLAEAKDSGIYEPAQVANMDAMLKQMDAAIADAEANQQDVAFVTRRPAEPISATKAKIRHEAAHLSQSRIAADLSALTGKNWLDSQPNAKDIHKELDRRGYAPETHDYEAAAFVASGDYGVFGMNLDQAAKFLSDYFGAVVEKHGKRALQKFGAIDPKLQPTLEAARRETETRQTENQRRSVEAAQRSERRIGAASEARGSSAGVRTERRERRQEAAGSRPARRGQVLASGLGAFQNLFERDAKPKEAKPAPLPKDFDLAKWSQKSYTDALVNALSSKDRAEYSRLKTAREKQAFLFSTKIDPDLEAKVFKLIDRAAEAYEKGDGIDFQAVRDEVRSLLAGQVSPSLRDVKWYDHLQSRLSNVNFKGTYERIAGEQGKEISEIFRNAQVDAANGKITRAEAVTRLQRELKPYIRRLKSSGKPGLARWVENHIDAVSDPDQSFKGLAGFLRGFQYNFKLRLNPRSAIINTLQPFQTLWPHLTTAEWLRIQKEAAKPATWKRISDVAARESGGSVEEVNNEKRFLGWADLFSPVSEYNRIVGHLAGELFADRNGLTGDAKARMAADWAKKVEFDNSAYDIPPLFSGKIAGVVGQFKPFMVKNLERLYTDWKSAPPEALATNKWSGAGTIARRSKMVLAQFLIGGVRAGIPGLKHVGGVLVLGALAKAFGKIMDDDEAEKLAEAVYFGAPALVEQDLSGSVAIFDEPFGKTGYEKMVNFAGGPTLSLIAKAYEEGKNINDAEDSKTQTKTEKQQDAALRFAKAVTPYTKWGIAGAAAMRGERPSLWLGKETPMTTAETVGYSLLGTPLRQSKYYEHKEAYDWQKGLMPERFEKEDKKTGTRILPDGKIDAGIIRQKVGEPEAIYKQRVQRVEGWMSEYGDKLLSHPRYGTLTAAQQEAAIESLRRRIGTQQNATRPRLDSLTPEKIIQSVLKSEATRPKREAGKLWSPP